MQPAKLVRGACARSVPLVFSWIQLLMLVLVPVPLALMPNLPPALVKVHYLLIP